MVPKGDICCTSTCLQHRVEGLFENPDTYDHTRFLPPRCEDKNAKFTFIGFGGGRHGCMGTNFAYLQIKTVRCRCGTAARAASAMCFRGARVDEPLPGDAHDASRGVCAASHGCVWRSGVATSKSGVLPMLAAVHVRSVLYQCLRV